MSVPELLVLGLVHHQQASRTRSQKIQARLIERELQESGVDVVTVEEFEQVLRDPADVTYLGLRMGVFRRLWAQEIHHLREIRRRRGSPLSIPMRKRRQALARVFSIVANTESLIHAFRRLEIEAALSLKHLRIWEEVLDSDAIGAIVLEDDFYLRRGSSPAEMVKILRMGSSRHDLIDLAGGLTRKSLGLPESRGNDLSLPFLVSNTTCAYFMNRKACRALVNMVARNKELLYLAPDFLITELNETGFEGSSLLPWDLPLVHGSRDGTVESSIPY